jgi:hypothetical protein
MVEHSLATRTIADDGVTSTQLPAAKLTTALGQPSELERARDEHFDVAVVIDPIAARSR